MLRLFEARRGGVKMEWDEEDIVPMSRIIGGQAAESCVAPLQPSVLRLARKLHVQLSANARQRLQHESELRATCDTMQRVTKSKIKLPTRAPLFAHQAADLQYIRQTDFPAYLLAHQTGVGKSLIAIGAAAWLWQAERICIICPNKAKRQWRRAIQHWVGADESIMIVEGIKRRGHKVPQQIRQAMTDKRWVIGHWESLVNAAEGYLDRPWDVVILDEGHRINNRDTQRAEVAFAMKATRRLLLTAHPYTNATDELWSILRFLYPKTYSSFWRFFYQHVRVQAKAFGGFEVLGAKRPNLLKWELRPYTIRRTKQSVFGSLPPITRSVVECPLTARGQREYDRLKKQVFVELDALGGRTKVLPIINDLSRLTRLRQYLVDPGLLGAREPSVKYEMVLDWLDDLDGPPMLFTSFRQAAVRCAAFLQSKRRKMRIALLTGGMTAKAADLVQQNFLKGKYDLVLAVTAAAQEALNYGKYGYVGHLDLPWNPRTFEQTEGRVDRPEEGTGKLVPTTSWRFIVPDSYEERLEAKLEHKHADFARVFTVGQLRRLFD
jgi:SNF2 family DNA or RNA helicase